MKSRIEVVKLVVENSDGKVLVVREKESKKWELPGGKMKEKSKEPLFDAASRELKEEADLEMNSATKLVRTEIEEFNEKPIVNCHIIHTDDFKGEVEIHTNELDNFKWIKPEEFKNLDWHPDAGYGIPPVEQLQYYLR